MTTIILAFLRRYWVDFVLLAGVLGGLWFTWHSGVRYDRRLADAEIASINAKHQQQLDDIDRENRTALDAERAKAQADHDKQVADMAAMDAKFTKENEDAKRQADADSAAVRAGTLRVRDRFECAAAPSPSGASGGVPSPAASTGMGHAAQAGGLQRDDAEFLLREGHRADEVVRQLQACQAIVARDRAR